VPPSPDFASPVSPPPPFHFCPFDLNPMA
jgi:hypothetical protein